MSKELKSREICSLEIRELEDIQELDLIEFHSFRNDWFGAKSAFESRFRFALLAQDLLFEFTCTKPPQGLGEGGFEAELWRSDCAEFFIAGENSEPYQEFNFSPSGSFWAARFDSYRSDALETKHPNLRSQKLETASGWGIRAHVPLEMLDFIDFGRGFLLNPCLILGAEPEQNFYSFYELGKTEPDFHFLSELKHRAQLVNLPK